VLVGGGLLVVNGTARGSTDFLANPASTATAPTRAAVPATPAIPPASSATVGALFAPGQSSHFCTADVVDSPRGDVIVTAAHCLTGSGSGLRFVPGYGPSGTGPAGSWTVTGAYADPAWLSDQDIQHDYAFLTVAPADATSGGRTLQAAVGAADRLSPATIIGQSVELFGYPAGSHDPQITCSTRVSSTPDGDSGAPTVACPGFRGGTSGSPWIQRGPGGDRLVGLVGGLHQGGCSDDISHSPVLDATATAVLARAVAGAPSDTLPVPDDDGC
jgi:V8-like Glu-specific endopeptidase